MPLLAKTKDLMKKIITILLCISFCAQAQQITTEIDLDFGNNGNLTFYNSRSSCLFGDNDKIFVAGVHNSFGLRLNRLLADGTLDTSFGNQGEVVNSDAGDNFIPIRLSKLGNDLLISWSGGVYKYDQEGNIDTTFGDNGKVDQRSAKIFLLDNDRILLLDLQGNVSVFDADGKRDQNFNISETLDFLSFAYDGAQKIYALCEESINQDIKVVRFDLDGNIDTSFADNGVLVYDFADDEISDFIPSLCTINNGKILIAGTNGFNRSGNVFIKFLVDGSLDTDFGDQGYVKIQYPNTTYKNYPQQIINHLGNQFVGIRWSSNATGTVQRGYILKLTDTGIDERFNDNGYFITDNNLSTFDMNANAIITVGEGRTGGWDRVYGYLNSEKNLTISEHKQSIPLKVFPTPAISHIHISGNQSVDKVDFFDAKGEKLKTVTDSKEIDITKLKQGVYFLKVYIGEKVQSSKILKR